MQDVPKGVILFVNITPALLVKIGWPYFVPGRVRYGRRVLGCSLISFLGIIVSFPSFSELNTYPFYQYRIYIILLSYLIFFVMKMENGC